MTSSAFSAFRDVSYTGVLYVSERASKQGYTPDDSSWINLGQGAPEAAALPDAPARLSSMQIEIANHEYSNIAGCLELRQKVADLYNHLYRQSSDSKYTYENVSISGGGRIGLARIIASLGNINLGHFIPDYTAYEEILGTFNSFVPIPILLEEAQQYQMAIDEIEKEVLGRGLKALLMSNPANPTGQVLKGSGLEGLVKTCRFHDCALIMDEFYSHYLYSNDDALSISAASYVEDVNQDPIILLNGLTKNWRYPGWRICWTIAPKDMIKTLNSVGSFLDGGANHPLQREAIPLLEPEYMKQETLAIQKEFKAKRDYTLQRLEQMGIEVNSPPQGTFYAWANLSKLPPPLSQGLSFFEACLKQKVIVVPGIFFDVNPEKRRKIARYSQYIRISFGPDMDALKRGLDAIEYVIKSYL